MKDWEWIDKNISRSINDIDSEEEKTAFVHCKVHSYININLASNSVEGKFLFPQ